MKMRQRLETLEAKATPRSLHVVAAFAVETWQCAQARYGKPIAENDLVVLIRKPALTGTVEGNDA